MEGFQQLYLLPVCLDSAPAGAPGLFVAQVCLMLPFSPSSPAVITVRKIYESSVSSRRPLTFSAANWRCARVNEVLIQSGAEAGHFFFIFYKWHHVTHLLPLVTYRPTAFFPACLFQRELLEDNQRRLDRSIFGIPSENMEGRKKKVASPLPDLHYLCSLLMRGPLIGEEIMWKRKE